jgi:hypothetical protein
MTRLTDAEREELLDEHEARGMDGEIGYVHPDLSYVQRCCFACDENVPCRTSRLLAELAAHEAREAELIAALEAGDACGAVGCRALAERDALLEREARVVELAEWFDAQVNWREWGIGNQIRRALDGDQP